MGASHPPNNSSQICAQRLAVRIAKAPVKSEKKEEKNVEEEYTKDRIQRIVDGLDEQLAKGNISEKTHRELRKKWEAKLIEE